MPHPSSAGGWYMYTCQSNYNTYGLCGLTVWWFFITYRFIHLHIQIFMSKHIMHKTFIYVPGVRQTDKLYCLWGIQLSTLALIQKECEFDIQLLITPIKWLAEWQICIHAHRIPRCLLKKMLILPNMMQYFGGWGVYWQNAS